MEEGVWKAFLTEMEELLGEGYPAYLESFSQPWYRGLRVNTGKISPLRLAALLEKSRGTCLGRREGAFLENGPQRDADPNRIDKLLAPVPWTANGYYYDPGWAAAKDPYYYAGLYYLQEPSAMTPASRLPVEPGDRVLDLCAAPGGKATELGVRLQGEGLLFANDISNTRAKALLKNLELFGISNICVTSESPQKLAEALPGFFDKILVDAPCSGEGMLRREPDMIKDWAVRGPDYYAPLQRDILCQAVRLLKPGGCLLYSTCTFSKKEDEENVLWLLARFPEMELVPLTGFPGASDGFGLSGVLRLFPHKIKGEGHFLALLCKKTCGSVGGEQGEHMADKGAAGAHMRNVGAQAVSAGAINAQSSRVQDSGIQNGGVQHNRATASGNKRRHGKAAEADPSTDRTGIPAGLEEFLADLSLDLALQLEPGRVRQLQDKLFYLPEGFPEEAKLRYLRTGLYLGDLKKGRFEPSQALAMAVKPEGLPCALRLSHEDERVLRYLKGETIFYNEAGDGVERDGGMKDGLRKKVGKKMTGKEPDKSEGKNLGWRLVCLEDFPLGWARANGSMLKNKYYPGWRYR